MADITEVGPGFYLHRDRNAAIIHIPQKGPNIYMLTKQLLPSECPAIECTDQISMDYAQFCVAMITHHCDALYWGLLLEAENGKLPKNPPVEKTIGIKVPGLDVKLIDVKQIIHDCYKGFIDRDDPRIDDLLDFYECVRDLNLSRVPDFVASPTKRITTSIRGGKDLCDILFIDN